MAAASQELVEWPEMARDRADEVRRHGDAMDLPRMTVDLARTRRGFTPARVSAMAGWENPFRQEFGMPEAGNTLTLETTQGQVVIDMRPDLAPAHVAHIKKLAGEKFYDGVVFHRVIEGFMAQTGCPHGTGTGGSKYPNLKAEFNAEPHVRGTCSMARAQDVNSANSQFFICFGDARFLDKQYTVWGKVTAGMENVDKIKRGEPVRDPDRIVSATVG